LTALAPCGVAANAGDTVVERAGEFMALARVGNFDGAAKLFHYPTNYTRAELARDEADMAQSIRELMSEIGGIEGITAGGKLPDPSLFVAVESGNPSYWASRPS
jgi:hypothetical protein